MKKIQKTNKFKVAVVMLLCMVAFSVCSPPGTLFEGEDFRIFKYNEGIDYSENMPDYYPQYSNKEDPSWYGGWRSMLKTTKLADNYYAARVRDVNDVYLTTLTIAEYIELDSLHLLTQAFIDSLPKDSNVYCDYYSAKLNAFIGSCWIRQGSGRVLDTAKLNLIIRNCELDKYFYKEK